MGNILQALSRCSNTCLSFCLSLDFLLGFHNGVTDITFTSVEQYSLRAKRELRINLLCQFKGIEIETENGQVMSC